MEHRPLLDNNTDSFDKEYEKNFLPDDIEDRWVRWVLQTSKTPADISSVLKLCMVESVNNDHRQLITYALELNNMIDNIRNGAIDIEVIKNGSRLIENFLNYTHEHFSREEQLIQKFNLPFYDKQIEQHQLIIEKLENLLTNFKSGRLAFTQKLKLMLLEWVIIHVISTDMETFKLEHFNYFILNAHSWSDFNDIIRRVGISEIDDQHQVITKQSLKILQMNKDRAITIDSLDLLDSFVNEVALLKKLLHEHFIYEEKLIKNYNIPNLEKQSNNHKQFLTTINSLEVAIKESNKLEGIEKFRQFIITWWINHINNVDYATFSIASWAPRILESAQNIEEIKWILKITGIPEIDTDHLYFVENCIKLTQLIQADPETALSKIVPLFQEMVEYAIAHFAREEVIMKKENIPNVHNHIQEHQRISKFLLKKNSEFESGFIALASIHHLKAVILEQWFNHTNIVDYRTFVEERYAINNEEITK
ncbi:MAG: hypothetical protein HQK53_00130 [Oligoflexia bacterium]|nr:hypothetical protein [Oligoflexia bacterium]